MPLRVDEEKLYDSEYRNHILETVTRALIDDKRIAGALLVGSGAKGFHDRYSDVDLTVLVGDETQLEEIYVDWWERLHDLLPTIDAFKEPSSHLYGLLLNRYMEIDIGFQGESALFERKPNWKILFDRRGVIPSLMKPREKAVDDQSTAHDKRLQDSWYYIIHTISAIQRGQPLRANFFINFLRDEAILMAGLNRDLATSLRSYHKEADKLPEEVKKKIINSIPANTKPVEQLRALRTVVNLYYEEAEKLDRKLGMQRTKKLQAAMKEYLTKFS
jgi:predicted nucleotidyltransferase